MLRKNLTRHRTLVFITALAAFVTTTSVRAEVLARWNFDVGTTSSERLAPTAPAGGVTVSSLFVNSAVADFGVGTVPSGEDDRDDRTGFGGNNGEQVLFWRRANYTNTTAPIGKTTTWGVPGVDAGIDTTVVNAPMSFTVTAGPGQTVIVENLLINNSSGSAWHYDFSLHPVRPKRGPHQLHHTLPTPPL